jgi:paraquat-inducible protein B
VTFRGVRVGSVEAMDIQYDARTGTALIPVTVRLQPEKVLITHASGPGRPDLSVIVAKGLRAELNVQSFVTGQSAVDLDFYPGSELVLHKGVTDLPEIPTRQSTLQVATEQLGKLPLHELTEDATATLVSLRALTERLNADLPPLVASLKATSDKSADAVTAATGAIRDLQGRLDTTLDAFAAAAVTGDRQLSRRGAELHTLLTGAGQSVQQLRDMLGDLKGLANSRGEARADIDSTLRDLAAATASLRGFAGDIERDPKLLLTGRKP